MATTICDFCLSESKGLFHRHERLSSGHYICKECRAKIEEYGLPVKYDLFQTLLTVEPNMRATLIDNYLTRNDIDHCIAKFFPLPPVLLHDGEQCINYVDASITVDASLIPTTEAVTRIADISKKHINNLPDAKENGTVITGKLFETDAAVYFLSPHFINCHRLSTMIKDYPNPDVVYVLDHKQSFSYQVKHVDLFYLRDTLYQHILAKKENKSQNLIYLRSENTMTITPGSYSVPRNIQPGVYWINPVKDGEIHFSNATGEPIESVGGRVRLDDGDKLEVTGEYEFRYRQKEEPPTFVPPEKPKEK